MPVTINVLPSARLVTMIMMIGMLSASPTCSQVRQRVASIRPTPISALTEIGNRPKAAVRMTKAMTDSARLARCVCGSSIVPSSTSIVPFCFSESIAFDAPCTSSTSPARSRILPMSCVTRDDGKRARCSASGNRPNDCAKRTASSVRRCSSEPRVTTSSASC